MLHSSRKQKAISMTLELKPIVEDVDNIISIFKAISCITSKANLTGLAKEQTYTKFDRGVPLFIICEGSCATWGLVHPLCISVNEGGFTEGFGCRVDHQQAPTGGNLICPSGCEMPAATLILFWIQIYSASLRNKRWLPCGPLDAETEFWLQQSKQTIELGGLLQTSCSSICSPLAELWKRPALPEILLGYLSSFFSLQNKYLFNTAAMSVLYS